MGIRQLTLQTILFEGIGPLCQCLPNMMLHEQQLNKEDETTPFCAGFPQLLQHLQHCLLLVHLRSITDLSLHQYLYPSLAAP